MQNIIGQDNLIQEINKIIEIFKKSKGVIRPHFILTGESGSGKSLTIETLAKMASMQFLEVNAAQLTREGTSGNSLSKALSKLVSIGNTLNIVFVEEFDKLFISSNNNSELSHEATVAVQNEFLRVLEADTTQVFGDYGKYITASTKNTLFVFAGAFNGEANITIDRLREFGIKTEFLGRVGLIYSTNKLSLEHLYQIVDENKLLSDYCKLFEGSDKERVGYIIKEYLKDNYDNNTLGARLINTIVHQYFIKGGKLSKKEIDDVAFQTKLELGE